MHNASRAKRIIGRPGWAVALISAVAMAATALPAYAAPARARTERYDWRYHGDELDMPGMWSLGFSCVDGSDCFTLQTRAGEDSITLDVRSLNLPVFAFYTVGDYGPAGRPNWGPARGFCGRTTIRHLAPGEPVTLYFTGVQNPRAMAPGEVCAQGVEGQFTATFR